MMKKLLLILIASSGLLACKTADKKSDEEKAREQYVKDSVAAVEKNRVLQDTANFSSIQWLDSTFLDLGKVTKGKTVEVSFRFKNSGTKPLVITDVQPGCGCTIPEKPEQPFAPGEEGTIKAKFESKNQHEGEHTKNITVIANTSPESTMLTFRVSVTN
jgi:hypothetical protein